MTIQKPQEHSVLVSIPAQPSLTIGISDLTARVDQRSKAVLATEEAAACGMRIEILRGQLMVETERFTELHKRAQAELDAELKRVTGGGM